MSSRSIPQRQQFVIVCGLVVALAALGFLFVRQSLGGASKELASSGDGVVEPSTIEITTKTTLVTRTTKFVSPDQPTAVGIKVMTFNDITRGTSARGEREELSTRPLTVVVRYPTAGMATDDDIPDAPGFESAPLVLFAHGYDISTQAYSLLLHNLAASGYVVAAPEFPMSSTIFEGEPDEYDLPEQARDLSFLINAMTGPDASPELASLISSGPVGLVGHSDGAVTALLASFAPRFADSRVGAVAAISGGFDTFGGNWFSTNDPPLLAIHGEYDAINPLESSEVLVKNDPGSAMFVRVMGASHLGAVTEPENALAVARLIAFEFRWRLEGELSAQPATIGVAESPPLQLVSNHD